MLGEKSELLRRPILAGSEIGVARFIRWPAMLKAPFLDLSQKHGGGSSTFSVLKRHPEQADAQFV